MTDERKKEIEVFLAHMAEAIQNLAAETKTYISISGNYTDNLGAWFHVAIVSDNGTKSARSLEGINGILENINE